MIVLILTSFGCGKYRPFSSDITVNELSGKWIVTEDSLRYLAEKQLCCTENLTTFVLTRDGRAELKNIPDCWAIVERECKGSLDFTGSWQLFDKQDLPKEILFISNVGKRQVGYSIFIVQRRDDPEKLALLFGLGETDIKREIYLEKAD